MLSLLSSVTLPCLFALPELRPPSPAERRRLALLTELTGTRAWLPTVRVTDTAPRDAARVEDADTIAFPAALLGPERGTEALSWWLRAIAPRSGARPSAMLRRLDPAALHAWRGRWSRRCG